MAKNYKPVEYSSTTFESRKYYKRQTFLNTDEGISSVQFRSESIDTMDDSGPISYTHWLAITAFFPEKFVPIFSARMQFSK